MAQLNLYVDEKPRKLLERKAKSKGLSLSRYVTQVLERELGQEAGWPKGYFEQVLGSWQGDLKRPSQGKEEAREHL